jgi:hypothetical protein
MFENIFKNPIIIGLIFGTIAYLYLLKQKHDKEKKAKKNKNKKVKIEEPNILIPVAVSIISGCFVWYYFGKSAQTVLPNNNMTVENLAKEPLQNEEIIDSLTGESNNSVSYHLVGKGINMPNNLPDVFLDMDGFDN